jgi:hypothetical protein
MAQVPDAKRTRLAEFLESTPPDTQREVVDAFGGGAFTASGTRYQLKEPDIRLHCGSEECQGLGLFQNNGADVYAYDSKWSNVFVYYVCRNCSASSKVFALGVRCIGSGDGEAIKFGEFPAFGPPTPARVISLIGPDRELFLRGRRAENLGFGIGSFAYYRRVVENQKGRIIHEIAKASAKLGASTEMLGELRRAERETQFSKAIEEIKAGIPAALLIGEHNPLTLLHTALSEGLHDHTDEACLEIAQEIRLILTELAERISHALKEEAELKQAVSRLLNRKKSDRAGGGEEPSKGSES